MWCLVPGGIAAVLLLGSCHRADPWTGTALEERRIYNACFAFSSVNGRLPTALDDLVPDYLQDRGALGDPDHPEVGEIGYYYFGSGSSGAEAPATVFLASKVKHRGLRALICFGGDGAITAFNPPAP